MQGDAIYTYVKTTGITQHCPGQLSILLLVPDLYLAFPCPLLEDQEPVPETQQQISQTQIALT